jgi:hypothetical protein
MAEIVLASQQVSKSAVGEEAGSGKRGSKGAQKQDKERKPRKKKVKGYGMDLLRTAAERRMAESSQELAEALVAKAIAGRIDSVKVLMKLAEEEKDRMEEVRENSPEMTELLFGSTTRIGQVWDGTRWKRIRKGKTVEGEPEPKEMGLREGIQQAMIDNGECRAEDFEDEKISDWGPLPGRGLLGDGRGEDRE